MTAPPLTHATIFRLAMPIVLSNATVPLLGAVDTAVIGQLGAAAPLGAVGIGAVILSTLYWCFGFLRMTTSGLSAQAQGAGDGAEVSAVLIRALILAAAAGLALIAAQGLLFASAFAIAPASARVEDLARSYLGIRIWGAPATIALYAITGWLIGLGRTRGVLVLQLAQNGVNIALSVWFVIGLGWGVPGVATATLIAEAIGLLVGLWLARAAFGAALKPALARLRDAAAVRLMFGASRDILLRTVILQLSFTSFVFLGARFGDVTLAANQVLLQFLQITAFGLDGIAFAAEALIGAAVGAKNPAAVQRASRMAMQWGFGGAAVLALTFALAGGALIDVMTTAPDVRASARGWLPWLVAAPLVGVASWIYDGIFIGAMLTREMLRAMALSVAIYVAALVVLVPLSGNHGLWAALMVLLMARGATMRRAAPAVLRKAARSEFPSI